MKLIGILIGLIYFAPIYIAGIWWITLPLYYLLLGAEFWSMKRFDKELKKLSKLFKILIVQVFLPFTPIILYPFMPGRTHTGEPLGLNEKAYLAICIGIILSLLGLVIFGLTRRKLAREIKRVEQGVPGYRRQSAPQPEP